MLAPAGDGHSTLRWMQKVLPAIADEPCSRGRSRSLSPSLASQGGRASGEPSQCRAMRRWRWRAASLPGVTPRQL